MDLLLSNRSHFLAPTMKKLRELFGTNARAYLATSVH